MSSPRYNWMMVALNGFPTPNVTVDFVCRPVQGCYTFSRDRMPCKSNEPGKGLTNGAPWKGSCEVSAATEIGAHKW